MFGTQRKSLLMQEDDSGPITGSRRESAPPRISRDYSLTFLVAVRLSLTCLMPIFLALPASATLIDIVVVGIWESANVNAVINKFGFVNGDKFVMKATYDDSTFFNGSEGVTSDIDPGINPGTSFNVIIPHAAGAPNPLQFDHDDHTSIGFAPNAQIEFDGPNAGNPGNFRNFEVHVDFNYAGDQHDLDLYMGAIQETSELYNESQGFNLAATGNGSDHLSIVVNDITADAGGPYVFDASNLSLNLNGTSGGGSGFTKDFDWSNAGGAVGTGANVAFGLVTSGLTDTTDTTTLDLDVTELFTDFTSSTSVANVSYSNTAPLVLAVMGVGELDNSITLSATTDDDDLLANVLITDFETLDVDFLYNASVFQSGPGNVNLATLLLTFGSPGTYSVTARVTDKAGAADSISFNINVLSTEVPSLSPLALIFLTGLVGFASYCLSRVSIRSK